MRAHLTCLLLFLGFASAAGAKPLVVTSNTILADLVQVIGGNEIEARCLVVRGGDPHSYEPRPADIALLSRADVLVTNGLGFETWLDKVLGSSGFRGKIVVAAKGIVPLRRDHDHHHDHSQPHEAHGPRDGEGGAVDPHAWHDLRHVRSYVNEIRDALTKAAPDAGNLFAQRAESYGAELASLHVYASEQFQSLPPARRKLVTSHDALHYLGEAFGLQISPVRGLQPDREPSAKQLAGLIRFIREQGVPAVFIESTSNPKLINLLARDAGVKVVGELYTDSLGPEGSPGATFLGMYRANVDTIVSALR